MQDIEKSSWNWRETSLVQDSIHRVRRCNAGHWGAELSAESSNGGCCMLRYQPARQNGPTVATGAWPLWRQPPLSDWLRCVFHSWEFLLCILNLGENIRLRTSYALKGNLLMSLYLMYMLSNFHLNVYACAYKLVLTSALVWETSLHHFFGFYHPCPVTNNQL